MHRLQYSVYSSLSDVLRQGVVPHTGNGVGPLIYAQGVRNALGSTERKSLEVNVLLPKRAAMAATLAADG